MILRAENRCSGGNEQRHMGGERYLAREKRAVRNVNRAAGVCGVGNRTGKRFRIVRFAVALCAVIADIENFSSRHFAAKVGGVIGSYSVYIKLALAVARKLNARKTFCLICEFQLFRAARTVDPKVIKSLFGVDRELYFIPVAGGIIAIGGENVRHAAPFAGDGRIETVSEERRRADFFSVFSESAESGAAVVCDE